MPSASAYINRRRIFTEASVVKVQYPGGLSTKNRYLSVGNVLPSFRVLDYTPFPRQIPPLPCLSELNGGNAYSSVSERVDGGTARTIDTSCHYDGGSAGSPYYNGGNAFSNPSVRVDGNVY